MNQIPITKVKNISIGHAQDEQAKTGVTVIHFQKGALVGCDISGGGPASRETPLTNSMTADTPVNAVVLSGGSAFGLGASDGVMKCLDENGIGYDTGFAKVPIVCQSSLYDLGYGSSTVRPDRDMGYKACQKALSTTDGREGNIGAGIGATVGKLCGMKRGMKSGLGIYAFEIGELQVAAIVVVNAFGDVYDGRQKIAGLLDENREKFVDTSELFAQICKKPTDMFTGNTTIGAVITNAKFDKGKLNKIASMARNGYARAINPVGTMADGDSIYACSVGNVVSDINLVGILGAKAMEKAILRAVETSQIDDVEYLKNALPQED